MDEEEPKRAVPYITYVLLTALFVIQLYLNFIPSAIALELFETYSLIPARLFDGVMLDSVLTYIFLHGSWAHLAVNCVALYGAGAPVENEIGHIRFAIGFLVSGVFAGVAHSFLNPSSSVPLIGSSGAIFGIIAILFLLMPFKLTYALVIPLPSVVVGLMLSLVELSALGLPVDLAVAHEAHMSGFIFGCIYAFVLDMKRAVKGLFIAAFVLALMYYVGKFYSLI
ncbi:MAG: rhomboid family intramembrane serine protease [Candidatus Bathyarchaeota archaeon]|nr:MAG: rhomboid family intramembrane serine protease [Candidatus Bathyarchaeota archaeon]